jgi:hypothetical protein
VSSFDLDDWRVQNDKKLRPVRAAGTPESKDVSQNIGDSLIGDIAAVASAILGGGSEVASAASAGAGGLEATPLLAGSSVFGDGTVGVSSILREVNSQIQQATSIVEAIVGDATSIVGSILAAATSPSNIGALPHINSNSSMNGTISSSANITSSMMSEPQSFCTICNSSHPIISYNTTITAMPCPSSAIALATTGISFTSTIPSCPSPITETCTVTETWHSTHYAETATFYSFIANSTVTYTETIRYDIRKTRRQFTNRVSSQRMPSTSCLPTSSDVNSSTTSKFDRMYKWGISQTPGGLSIYAKHDLFRISQHFYINFGLGELPNSD